MRRVAVTGLGLVTPLGSGVGHVWKRLVDGESGIRAIQTFDVSDLPCKIAGTVPVGESGNGRFDPDSVVSVKDRRKMDDFIVYTLGAAAEAVEDAGWTPDAEEELERTGVLIGSGIGGLKYIFDGSITMSERGPRRVTPFFIPATLINLASGQVSIRWNAKGPNSATATACTSGAHAVGDSFRLIQNGYADAMICGGAEAAITPMSIAGFAAMKALSKRNDNPKVASRPWDADRDGFVVGEFRQNRFPSLRPPGTAACDFNCIGDRLRQVGEQFDHLILRLEIVLLGQFAAAGSLIHGCALGDADQRIMRLKHRFVGKVDIIGRHQRQTASVSQVNQIRLHTALANSAIGAFRSVPLQLDI